MQTFTLPKLLSRDRAIPRVAAFLSSLSLEHGWVIKVERLQRRRSGAQNRYLWGVCYPAILKHLEGWTADDVHEFCLGEHFGWERLEGLGRPRLKPLKRSAKLLTIEFRDYVEWIQRTFAERGVYVPDPNEDVSE